MEEGEDGFIIIRWHYLDVADQATRMGIELNDDEAREILQRVAMKHNSYIGINWDVISVHIMDFVDKREEDGDGSADS